MNCINCGTSLLENETFCKGCGIPIIQSKIPQQQSNNRRVILNQEKQLGMGWYRFLIYFVLFANAGLSFCYGLNTITGAIYHISDVNAVMVYSTYPSLKAVDKLYGTLSICASVLLIITRQYLAHYKAIGIKMFYCVYIVSVALSVLYDIVTSSILEVSTFDSSVVSQLIISIVFICLNIIYFNKRKHLFL